MTDDLKSAFQASKSFGYLTLIFNHRPRRIESSSVIKHNRKLTAWQKIWTNRCIDEGDTTVGRRAGLDRRGKPFKDLLLNAELSIPVWALPSSARATVVRPPLSPWRISYSDEQNEQPPPAVGGQSRPWTLPTLVSVPLN